MAKIKTVADKNKKKRLIAYFSHLSESEMIQIDHMITQSEYTTDDSVAYLQKELNKYCDVSTRTLRNKIYEYNKYVLKPKLLGEIDNIDVYKEVLALKGKVDTMKEFTVLVLHQRERLRKMINFESYAASKDTEDTMSRGHKDLSAQVRREIKIYGDLLEKLANIQMKTGVLRVAPKVISGEIIREGDEKEKSKITFKLTEDFMEHLDDIEGELLGDALDIKEIENDG